MRKIHLKRMIPIILAFSLCLIFVGCGKTKIDMKEYISVSFSKCNGYGQMEYTVDTEAIDALVKEEDVTKFAKDTMSFMEGLLILPFEDVTFSGFLTVLPEEKYSNLSNGDIVKFKLDVTDDLKLLDYTLEDIEKELKVEFSSTEFTYEVSGLQDAKVIDLLSIVKDYIVYEGASGGAKPDIEITDIIEKEYGGYYFTNNGYSKNTFNVIKDNERIGDIDIEYIEEKNLSNGDVFTLKIYKNVVFANIQDRLMDDGYMMLESIDVTVNGLGEYINDKEELKDDMITKTIEYLESKPYSYGGNYIGTYWGTLKSTAVTDNYELDKGLLFVVTSHKDFWGDTKYKAYGVRIIENAGGDCIFDLVGSAEFKDIDNIDIDKYELEKIN